MVAIDADLRNVDLRGANLLGAKLTAANLAGADLTGANLGGAENLEHADVAGVVGCDVCGRLPGCEAP